jgi:hypothetical protein
MVVRELWFALVRMFAALRKSASGPLPTIAHVTTCLQLVKADDGPRAMFGARGMVSAATPPFVPAGAGEPRISQF